MGTLIPALPASEDCCEKAKEKMSVAVFGGKHRAGVLCCLHCATAAGDAAAATTNNNFRDTDFCASQRGQLYIHDLNECPKQADE